MQTMLEAIGVGKTFTLHQRGGLQLPVLSGVDLAVGAGECLALTGRSGAGKSTLLRCLYGNYAATSGTVRIRHDGAWLDMTRARPAAVIDVRRRTLGHVAQFLRVIPRVCALDIVAEPLRRLGATAEAARRRAAEALSGLAIPSALWALPPATFSGGEQQRVNIARAMVAQYPVLLLDEPTASLDSANRAKVVELINQARRRGAAIVGIFHDEEVRAAVATRSLAVERVTGMVDGGVNLESDGPAHGRAAMVNAAAGNPALGGEVSA